MLNTIIFLNEVDSTNNYIKRNLAKLGSGCAVFANKQTAGRGKGMRTWHSNQGSLSFSLLCKFNKPQQYNIYEKNEKNLPLLATQIAGVAVCRTLNALGIMPSIKWPNDIIFGSLKVAGILIDVTKTEKSLVVIIGIGINVLQNAKGLQSINKQISLANAKSVNNNYLSETCLASTSVLMQIAAKEKLLKNPTPTVQTITKLAEKKLISAKNTAPIIHKGTINKSTLTSTAKNNLKSNLLLPINHLLVTEISNHILNSFSFNNLANKPLANIKQTLNTNSKNAESKDDEFKNNLNTSWACYWQRHSQAVGKKALLTNGSHFEAANYKATNYEATIVGITESGTLKVQLKNGQQIKATLSSIIKIL